jgi:DNA polymerase/3'-5' exonuclease PolX
MVCGSVRRKKYLVGDIEIVVTPKTACQGLFEHPEDNLPIKGFIDTVNQWSKVKGEPTGKYTQRILREGIKLDLFIANEKNYGMIVAIRTGSASFSFKQLAATWVKQGYHAKGGLLYKDNIEYTFPEEEDVFKFLGIPFIKPEDRI